MKQIEVDLQNLCSQITPWEYIEYSGASVAGILQEFEPKDIVTYLNDHFGDDDNEGLEKYGLKIARLTS